MQIDISVIIPVYNVENYIDECVQSISAQHFANMEILCVEDGSSDDSLHRLEVLARTEPRIRIIVQSENKGLSEARNTGLQQAIGKYVLFVDSDDYLDSNALNRLYNMAEEKGADIVYFDYIKFYDSTLKKGIATKKFGKIMMGYIQEENFFV